MAHAFVTSDLPGDALERLRATHEVELWGGPHQPPRDALTGREALLTMVVDPVDAGVIEASPDLAAIANYGVGTDNVDLAAATARGIPVGNTPDVLTETTADLAFGLMLAAARRIVEGNAAVRAGRWPPWTPFGDLGHDMHGATLGIVGYGRIGQAVARRGTGFWMEVLHTRDTPLDELLERSDFVSLHAPLNDSTRGMIGERELRLMKDTAVLVNAARGPLVQADALERALRKGWIAAAALDVTDPEPL